MDSTMMEGETIANPEIQKDGEKSAMKRSKRKKERLEQANTNTRRD